ncbi:hypothetical protein ACODM8_04650 [Vibrio ostreicida]|uniref:Uncharacterized protein n=1 Tax=Vibrio ostreicida TaxID=526588 RepID=A0ABT8BWX7_9VIBR|nr:hypothetical protein [Vibrio ostreicida]MDN3611493.1 hypothetical protein [Vibrio ostreicida]NPD08990.1 hypothetical protein [Vibrio ostreicida]
MMALLAAALFMVGLGVKIGVSYLNIGLWIMIMLLVSGFLANIGLHVVVSLFVLSPFLIKMNKAPLAGQLYGLCVIVPALMLWIDTI